MINKIKKIYHDYPPLFWRVMAISFIDQLGGAMIFPFFSLFVVKRFEVSMTQVGYLFLIFSIASIVGNIFGGALADKIGRKIMLIIGLLLSAGTMLTIGFLNDFSVFLWFAGVAGIFSMIGGPAQQALIADILPEEKRTEGFGLFRVIANLTVVIGPAIGGMLIDRSFLILFVIDAIVSTIAAILILFFIPETKPAIVEEIDENGNEKKISIFDTIKGYRIVFKDYAFLVFMLVGIFVTLGYNNMNSVLPVYMVDVLKFEAKSFGYLMSMNALMVVLFQFWITRKISKIPSYYSMAFGTALYIVSFLIFGFFNSFLAFVVGMIILTIGEMIHFPTLQKAIADFSPEDMRGRYMAISAFIWIIPSSVGVLIAGLIMDNSKPNNVWYFSALLSVVAALGYFIMGKKNVQKESNVEKKSVENAEEIS